MKTARIVFSVLLVLAGVAAYAMFGGKSGPTIPSSGSNNSLYQNIR